jgi:hypothetical protein
MDFAISKEDYAVADTIQYVDNKLRDYSKFFFLDDK